MGRYYISQNGYLKLYQEFLGISNQIGEINKKMGESAKRDNDLRENPEFMELRVKAMYELPRKRDELWQKYNAAIIIQEMQEYKQFDGTDVIIGAKVTLEFNGEECTYVILGNDEGDLENNILSCEAPLSKAIINRKEGEIIQFGKNTIKILKVEQY